MLVKWLCNDLLTTNTFASIRAITLGCDLSLDNIYMKLFATLSIKNKTPTTNYTMNATLLLCSHLIAFNQVQFYDGKPIHNILDIF